MVTYSLDFREETLIIGLLAAAFAAAYLAWKHARGARAGAWAAYDEIHTHRTQSEDDPHGDQFEWANENDGSGE